MKLAWLGALAVMGLGSLALAGTQTSPVLRITSPEPDTIVSGVIRLAVIVAPQAEVETVRFSVNGRIVCTVERPPFACTWDAGPVVRGHHVRVVATLTGGRSLVGNVRTKDLGYVQRTHADAVLVPVVVTHRGEFVRGLQTKDFEVFEDGVRQPLASTVSEDAALDLIVAIDISGSMEDALDGVKSAVKQFMSKLRPGDAATLVGFNDTSFIVAERETDPQAREDAVDLLTSWGGTALYDATVRALDLVSSEWGRKGVVIFSDGDDRHSLSGRDTAMARVEDSDAMLYTVGFGAGATVPKLRSSLESYARATGGRAFFPRHTRELDRMFDEIVGELANQYVLSYSSTNFARDNKWRNIKVQVRTGKYDIRARRGYRALDPQRAEKR